MKWRYSLRWKLPSPCPGEQELVSEVVEAGQQAPESVMSRWVAGQGTPCVSIFWERDRFVAGVMSVKPPPVAGISNGVLTGLLHCLRMN